MKNVMNEYNALIQELVNKCKSMEISKPSARVIMEYGTLMCFNCGGEFSPSEDLKYYNYCPYCGLELIDL